MAPIEITHYTDPGCPWAYSASPAMAVLRWRYGSQLRWRIVAIGLSEDPERYVQAGYTPARMTAGQLRFRRFGMPFLSEPRRRVAGTGRACRAIVATRIVAPELESEALRALQLGWFTTTLVLDEDADIAQALRRVPALDTERIVAAIDSEETLTAYEQDKREARTAEGGATQLQGKARQTDGPVRFSAPSLVFEAADGRRLEAGGFQPAEAYDLLVANLDPTLERRGAAADPLEALSALPGGLATGEVAAIMAANNEAPDLEAAERALIELLGAGSVRREAVGDGALWRAA
jgi:protein-disulfide isomerase-like protein with CxxC motif